METPFAGLGLIDERLDGFELQIPAKKSWSTVVFLAVWLCAWLGGEIFALRNLLLKSAAGSGFPDLFLLFWIAGWTVGGFFAVRVLVWNLVGKEIISARDNVLILNKKGLLFYRSKTYSLADAKNFRAEEPIKSYHNISGNKRSADMLNMNNSGTIKFDYGMQTIRFGESLTEEEANYILEKLRSKKMIV